MNHSTNWFEDAARVGALEPRQRGHRDLVKAYAYSHAVKRPNG